MPTPSPVSSAWPPAPGLREVRFRALPPPDLLPLASHVCVRLGLIQRQGG